MDSPIAEVKISLNREKIGNLPTQKKLILKNAAKWSILLGAVTFSCTPCVQEVHNKVEVVHLTPCLLGLGVLFNCHA